MAYDATRFAPQLPDGKGWSDLAHLGELKAVLDTAGSERTNLLLHAASLVAAKVALTLVQTRGILLDFGCGTGRMLRFFGHKGWSVIGTDITSEMLYEALKFGIPKRSLLTLIDGVSIPLRDQSVDMIWVCGVLKYSLFEPNSKCRGGSGPDRFEKSGGQVDRVDANQAFVPVYRHIAKEMYRALRPGGVVVNVEMYVNAPPDVFTSDFEDVGFVTKQVRILRRYLGRPETLVGWRSWHRFPTPWVIVAGQLIATLRYRFDNPRRGDGPRDYLFVWAKPKL